MPTSTDFVVLVLLSEIALYGPSAPTGISERIISLCLQTTKVNVNFVSVYAPTLGVSPDVKESFYEDLADTVRLRNNDGSLFILGDFNARVGNQWIFLFCFVLVFVCLFVCLFVCFCFVCCCWGFLLLLFLFCFVLLAWGVRPSWDTYDE